MLSDILYPFQVGQQVPREVSGDDVVASTIEFLLSTSPGEIDGMPLYGSRFWDYVYENNTGALARLVSIALVDALSRWVPYASLVRVEPVLTDNEAVFTVVWSRDGNVSTFEVGVPLP